MANPSNLPGYVGLFNGTTRSIRYAVSPTSGEALAGLRVYDDGGQSYCSLFRSTQETDNPDYDTWFATFAGFGPSQPAGYIDDVIIYEERPKEEDLQFLLGCLNADI